VEGVGPGNVAAGVVAGEALAQLGGGPAGEGDGQDLVGGHAVGQQFADAG